MLSGKPPGRTPGTARQKACRWTGDAEYTSTDIHTDPVADVPAADEAAAARATRAALSAMCCMMFVRVRLALVAKGFDYMMLQKS